MALDSYCWFTQLAQTGNFTRAADTLGISQQTLSARLAALEKELDAKLVVRSSPLTLTPAGTEFYLYAKEQEQARINMIRKVGDASSGGAGILKVAISPSRARDLMPNVIKEFRAGLPGVRVMILEGTNEELLRYTERGEVDIAVARFDRSHPGVDVRPLFAEEVVLAVDGDLLASHMGCDADSAVARIEQEGLSPLKGFPFLLEDDDDIAGRIGQAAMKKAGLNYCGVVRTESMSVLLEMCLKGLGAVFCPNTLLDAFEGSNHTLKRIHLTEPASYQISIGRPADAEPWTPAQTFEDILGALYGD